MNHFPDVNCTVYLSQSPTTYQVPSTQPKPATCLSMRDDGEMPGQRLLVLCSAKASEPAGFSHRKMTTFENAMLEECLTLGRSSESFVFRSYLAKAVRASIENKNEELVRRLLADEPVSHLVLREVKDVVNKAIRSNGRRRQSVHPTLFRTLRLLIDHGASVSSVDDEEDTPLILACRLGDCQLFKFLLEVGAAGEGGLVQQQCIIGPSNKPFGLTLHASSNLLKASWQGLRLSEGYAPADYFWKEDLDTTWCGIVMLLLDNNDTFSCDEPCLVTLLHMACVQGNLAYVRRFLDYGVNISVPADYFGDRVNVYGSAIHAAARGGHQDIIELLLSRGAKTNEKLTCKLPIPFCWALRLPLLAPFDISLMCGHSLTISETLGTTMSEKEALLHEVAVQGKTDLAKRLLEVGARLDEVPNTKSLEAIQLLQAHGSKIDHERLRRYAASCGCVEVLRYVIDEFGRNLSMDECLAIVQNAIRDKHSCNLNMLKFLINESGLKVNQVFQDTENKQVTNLLKIACLRLNAVVVRFLLAEGADPNCPGLPETALDTLRNQVVDLDPMVYELYYRPIAEALSLSIKPSGSASGLLDYSPSNRPSSNEILGGSSLVNDHASNESDFTQAAREGSLRDSGSPSWARSTRAMSTPDTYGAFKYHALQGLGAIRVIEIQPSQDGEAFLVCRLVHTNLASRPQYDTLSYVWGAQVTTGSPSIALNERKFFVTPNLWSAMHCLRHEKDVRVIWIDAICINQRDIQERNQQVSLMGDIYRRAGQVFIWLGEEADNSHMVFEQMHRGSHSDSFTGQTLRAYEKLCHRPWFYRTWVLQELALSKKATILCGQDAIYFKDFLPTSFLSEGFHPIQGQNVISHLHKMRELKGGHTSQVLACAMFCHATDVKDKVYGLLGILDHLGVEVDYALDISIIFQNFTQAIIQSEGLGILHLYGTQRLLPDLPSWVQDFSIMSPVGAISGGHNSRRAGNCDYILTETDGSSSIWSTSIYPSSIMPGMEFCGDALIIRGKRLERIKASGDELCADVAYAPGTNNFRQVLRGWETLATELLETKRFPHTISQAFLETLTVEDEAVMMDKPSKSWDEDSPSRQMHLDWYRQFGNMVLTAAENNHLKRNGHRAIWPDVLDTKDIDHSDVRYINDKVTNSCYGRNLFITYEGSMGLAAPRAQEDDQIVFLPGGRYPFVLRQREDGAWSLMGDCYLYEFNAYKLFEDSHRIVETFVIR